MNHLVDQYFDSLSDKKVAVLGIGVSNRPLIRMLLARGIHVLACDKTPREKLDAEVLELEQAGAVLHVGEGYLDDVRADVVFRTPGMHPEIPALRRLRAAGAEITSEMEAFFEVCPCRIIAVTGSDGKTTTTTLISKFYEAAGRKVHLGGNIGAALLPMLPEVSPEDVAVVELSSFQLISMRKSPNVAVVTNVTPNHLDHHKDMQEYIDAKKNILLHQGGISRTVLNADNPITASFLPLVRGTAAFFSRKTVPSLGAYLGEDGMLYCNDRSGTTPVLPMEQIRIPGIHNVENYLAAISAVWGEVDCENIVQVAQQFAGVEHRIEFVRELDGVKWYNDSIASSPTRTIAGLNSFHQKLILIAGGYDKKIPFEPLAPKIIEKVKTLILMGVTAPKIEAAVTACEGFDPQQLRILHAKDMQQAVELARQCAQPGDIVSLSPACASFDLYPDFEARGRHFKELVHQL